MKNSPTAAPNAPTITLRGVNVFRELLSPPQQTALVAELRELVARAPLFRPTTSRGQAMSVRMTSAGKVGWVSDRKGYRYEPHHPAGMDWPPIPQAILAIWEQVSGWGGPPDSCLINYYDANARMGMHQDRDESDLTAPVVSVSLGDDALFRVGNVERGGRTESIWLRSGDVVVLGGSARLLHHGVDRIRAGSSQLLDGAGRINLTLRVAT